LKDGESQLDRNHLTAVDVIETSIIVEMAAHTLYRCTSPIRESLFISKSEQTFSGLLAEELNRYPTLRLNDPEDSQSGKVLLEFKGKDYVNTLSGVKKNTRNFHDIVIVDHEAEIQLIIENKFWYHFDGCKGIKNPKPEKGIKKQLIDDISKIRQTLQDKPTQVRGLILLNIVTPAKPHLIPKSYRAEHFKVWERCGHDQQRYRQEGLQGVMSIVESMNSEFLNMSTYTSDQSYYGGFVDYICAEIKLD
jgi:hypothetical protein